MITYGDICRQVANYLRMTAGVRRVEGIDEMSEGVPELPILRVYVVSGETDSGGDDTERATFGAGVRRTTATIQVDGIARQRSHMREDMQAQMNLIDAIDARLSELKGVPLFGLQGVQAARWSWERMAYTVSDSIEYVGARFEIVLTIF